MRQLSGGDGCISLTFPLFFGSSEANLLDHSLNPPTTDGALTKSLCHLLSTWLTAAHMYAADQLEHQRLSVVDLLKHMMRTHQIKEG